MLLCLGFSVDALAQRRGSTNTRKRYEPVKETRIFAAGNVSVPFNRVYGPPLIGYGVSGGMFLDYLTAAIQPRVMFNYGGGTADSHFFHLQADLGAMWMAQPADITPLVGGGLGFAFLNRRGPTQTVTTGTVLQMTAQTADASSSLGVTAYARGGAVFFRRSTFSLQTTLDLTISAIGDRGIPLGAIFSVGALW